MKKLYFTIILISFCLKGYSMEPKPFSLQNERKERIKNAFNDLRADNLNILDGFYHKDLLFIDPIGQLKGLDKMKAYYKKMYQNVTSIRFDFKSLTSEGENIVGTWTMYLKAEGLNGGDEVQVEGVSHLTFDPETNLVKYHRDYFDMGEFIYEYIPLLGRIIKVIKGKLSHE